MKSNDQNPIRRIRNKIPRAGLFFAPAPLEKLEHLDDTIFEAINGDASAMDRARGAWNRARQELDGEALEESRQQYLRRALAEWSRLKDKPCHPPHRTFAALEIISLLQESE